jgi:predicted extracellular nuclease
MLRVRPRLSLLALLLSMSGALAGTAHAGPILYEVCYDGSGTDADDVFTEILATPGMDLTGWSLQGINGSNGQTYRTISLTGASVPDDGLLVIATSSAAGSVLSARDFTANVDWQNGADALLLLNEQSVVVDALQYGTLSGFSAGEGSPAADVAAGWSLSRDYWATDTDDNASDFFGLSTPTPGTRPSPVPEPGSLALVLAGGAALASARRRGRRGRAR